MWVRIPPDCKLSTRLPPLADTVNWKIAGSHTAADRKRAQILPTASAKIRWRFIPRSPGKNAKIYVPKLRMIKITNI